MSLNASEVMLAGIMAKDLASKPDEVHWCVHVEREPQHQCPAARGPTAWRTDEKAKTIECAVCGFVPQFAEWHPLGECESELHREVARLIKLLQETSR